MERTGESQSERDDDTSLASPQAAAYYDASGLTEPQSPRSASATVDEPALPHDPLVRGEPVAPNWLAVAATYRWYQVWYALRWKLATDIFSKPLPFVTAHLDLKLGDVIVTLPVAIALIAVGAVQLASLATKDNGGPAQVAMGLTFLLSVRNNSLLLALTGLSFERAIFYHKLFGVVTFITSSMHALSYVLKHHQVYGANASAAGRTFTQDDYDNASASAAVSGAVAYFPLAALVLCSFYVVRRHCFELFYRLHWLLFVAIIVGAILHGITAAIVAAALWAVDALYRLVYLRRVYYQGVAGSVKQQKQATRSDAALPAPAPRTKLGVVAPSQVTAARVAPDVVRIQFPATRADTGERFAYDAGQFAFVCVPALSLLQWHPFSISSAPHEPLVTFHIKALGDWTSKLLALVDKASTTCGESATASVPLEIFLDGPYGSISVDIGSQTTYSHVALVGGGIGITPMKSIVNQLYFEFAHLQRHTLQRVHLVWSVRDRALLDALVATDAAQQSTTALAPDAGLAPSSYFPNELAATAPVRLVFTTEIFLTKTERDVEQPVGVDPVLARSLRCGARPNVTEILRAIGVDALQHKQARVAVLACGPAALIKDVITASLRLGKEMNLRFDVHTETFEL